LDRAWAVPLPVRIVPLKGRELFRRMKCGLNHVHFAPGRSFSSNRESLFFFPKSFGRSARTWHADDLRRRPHTAKLGKAYVDGKKRPPLFTEKGAGRRAFGPERTKLRPRYRDIVSQPGVIGARWNRLLSCLVGTA